MNKKKTFQSPCMTVSQVMQQSIICASDAGKHVTTQGLNESYTEQSVSTATDPSQQGANQWFLEF